MAAARAVERDAGVIGSSTVASRRGSIAAVGVGDVQVDASVRTHRGEAGYRGMRTGSRRQLGASGLNATAAAGRHGAGSGASELVRHIGLPDFALAGGQRVSPMVPTFRRARLLARRAPRRQRRLPNRLEGPRLAARAHEPRPGNSRSSLRAVKRRRSSLLAVSVVHTPREARVVGVRPFRRRQLHSGTAIVALSDGRCTSNAYVIDIPVGRRSTIASIDMTMSSCRVPYNLTTPFLP
jgi:hypothetical protein